MTAGKRRMEFSSGWQELAISESKQDRY
jgi:hypothetical protein